MTLDPTTRAAILVCVLGVIYLLIMDEPRARDWIKAQWTRTAGLSRTKRSKGVAS